MSVPRVLQSDGMFAGATVGAGGSVGSGSGGVVWVGMGVGVGEAVGEAEPPAHAVTARARMPASTMVDRVRVLARRIDGFRISQVDC